MGDTDHQPAAENGAHITDHDLERYHLRMVEEPELTALEEHLLGCADCAGRAEQSANWVDAIRAAAAAAEADREP
jgi:hypothetical protein